MESDVQLLSSTEPVTQSRRSFRLPPGAGLVVVWLILVLVAFLSYSRFFELQNLENLMQQNVALGLIAVGVAFVIIGGNFDLSVGPVYGLSGVIFADVAQHHAIVLALLAGLGSGIGAGIVTAFVVTRLHITSFLASLATGTFFGGVALAASTDGTGRRYQGTLCLSRTGKTRRRSRRRDCLRCRSHNWWRCFGLHALWPVGSAPLAGMANPPV